MGRSAGVPGPGWERQPGAGGALRERTGAGDQRKPRRTACERGHRHAHGYSGQPARPPEENHFLKWKPPLEQCRNEGLKEKIYARIIINMWQLI
jgi:hypothetical protein